MNFRSLPVHVWCLCALLSLAGCGGGGGDGSSSSNTSTQPQSTQPQSTPTITGSVSKGPLRNANVIVYELDASGNKAANLGSATTDSSGQFSVPLSKTPAGAVQIEVSGGSYAGESQGDTVTGDTKPCKTVLSSVPSAGVSGVSVNPVTDMAAERAISLAAGGKTVADAITQAKTEIKNYFGFSVDVLGLTPSFDGTRAGGANSDSLQLGLLLIALDLFVHDASSTNPDAVYAALDTDFRNGALGGAKTYGNLAFTDGNAFKLYLLRMVHISAASFMNGVPASKVHTWAATHPQQATTSGAEPDSSSYYTCSDGTQLTYNASGNPVCWDGTQYQNGKPYLGSYYKCGTVATAQNPGTCSDGTIPVYSNSITTPPTFHAATIQTFKASPVKPFTAADRAAMNAATEATLPSYMTPIAGPLNQAQIDAYSTMNQSLQNFYLH